MKKTAIFLLAICCSVFAEAQMMPDSTVQVVAYWSKGDVISYDCAVTQYTIEADGTKKADYSSSETRTIEVIDADGSSYTLRLSYSDVFSPNPIKYLSSDQVNKLSEALTVTFKTNEFGTFAGIVDDDEAFDTYVKLVESIIDNAWKANKKELKGISREQFTESMKAPLCNKESMFAAVVSDFAPLLTFHGSRLDTAEVYSFPQIFTNLFGSETPLELDTQFWVDEKLTDSTCVVIRTDAYADYETLKPMVRDYSIKVAKAALESTGTEFDENEIADEIDKQMAEESVNVTFDEYTTIQIHLGTGWPVCWYSTREVVSTSEQAEKTAIIEKSVELHTEQ